MKVGYQGIYRFELVPGVYEDVGIPRTRLYGAVFFGDGLKHAYGRSADADHSSALFFRFGYDDGVLFVDAVILAVHFVIEHVFFLDWSESAKPDVEQDGRYLHAFRAYFVEQLGREMQSCGRSSRRAVRLAVHGLVSVLVL